MTSSDELNANLHKRNGIKVSSTLRQRIKQAVFKLKLKHRLIIIHLVLHLSTRISGSLEVSANQDAVMPAQNTIKCFLEELLTLEMSATTVG
jgi:fatty acid-binding protein DegV